MKPQILTGFFLAAVVAALSGCTTKPSPSAPEAQWRTTLVVAHGSSTPGMIQGVSDQFTYDGKIHAHATLATLLPVTPSTVTFTMKWFNGNKLVHERAGSHNLEVSPYYLVHAVPGSVLGVGACRVELYFGTSLIASRKFNVTER